MLETANEIGEQDEAAARKAAAWVSAAIEAVARAPAAIQTELALGGCAAHQLHARLAELQRAAGEGGLAAESYEAASEAALEAGKAKLAMKYSGLAAECAPDE